jgi:uncharacterized membrane protein
MRQCAPDGLAALFIGSGTLHLLRPELFAAAVPAALPAPGTIIAASGMVELLCGGALLSGRRWAGPMSAILLVAIFPGNVTVALATAANPDTSRRARVAAWARLPLQVPLVWAALQAGKSEKRRRPSRPGRAARRGPSPR